MTISQVWIKPAVHRALKIAAAHEHKTMGEIVEEQLLPRVRPFLSPDALDESTETPKPASDNGA